VRNINVNFALSELHRYWRTLSRGDAPHVVRRLPLAVIFRAFGAGNIDFLCKASGNDFAQKSLMAQRCDYK